MKKKGYSRGYIKEIVIYSVIYITIALFASTAISADSIEVVGPVFKIAVPENCGVIKDKYINKYSDLLIIHIQDLHCNFDAQMSISKLVDKLIKEDNFKLVTIEGSVGRLETAPFSSYPDENIKDKVARYFVKTGKIDGSAYAHIMNKSSFAFWGADDLELYKQNVEAFKSSLTPKPENNAFCDSVKAALDELKQKVYNKKLLTFDTQVEKYKQDKISFGDFTSYLNEIISEYKIDKKDYANFAKLVQVLGLEKDIDFTLVDTQRSECIEKLSKVLKEKELSELLGRSLHFKTGELSAVEFYSYLKEVVNKSHTVNFTKYAELGKYIDYILSYSGIEHIGLFGEIEKLQQATREKLFTRDIERQLDAHSKNIEVLKNLLNLKLTTNTLDYYRKNRNAFLVSNFIFFLKENAPKYRVQYRANGNFRNIDGQLPEMEKFYSLALERDKILVDNTLNKMNEINTKQAILVAGGFHTDGIIELLKERGVSYLVVTPKVNNLDEKNNPYLSVLLNKRTPFEELLHRQIAKNKRDDADAFVFQIEAKYFADAYKIITETLNKKK